MVLSLDPSNRGQQADWKSYVRCLLNNRFRHSDPPVGEVEGAESPLDHVGTLRIVVMEERALAGSCRTTPLTIMSKRDELLDGCPVDVADVEPIVAGMRSGIYLLAAMSRCRWLYQLLYRSGTSSDIVRAQIRPRIR